MSEASQSRESNKYPPTYRNSEMSYEGDDNRLTNVSSGGAVFRQTEMKILAAELDSNAPSEQKEVYKGRIKTWPGIILLVLIFASASVLITLGAIDAHDRSILMQEKYQNVSHNKRTIKDNTSSGGDLIDEDGQVGNPRKYPDLGCELPNYLSKNGKIVAQSKNGTEVPIAIKGVNWFGMETGMAIPFGLWENPDNGTSAYEIASFLSRNKFNSVRLPVCIKHILANTVPQKGLVNLATNRALNVSTYMSTLKSIVETLAYRRVSVLISLHTLDPRTSGGAWYSAELGVSENDFLDAVGRLTKNLCSKKYWNVIGLDLKNEPHESTWGGGAPDWQKGATLIGNKVLEGCPQWLSFVEGVNGQHDINIGGGATYFDWWGGGLENAGNDPVQLATKNKVVYAPHYYNTGVDPAWYFYGGGTKGGDRTLMNYIELSDADLTFNVQATMDAMFGYLTKAKDQAVILGEFAGLYATDKHPKKTTQRTTDITVQIMLKDGYAGGYMWSLNPESAYQFNPADVYAHFTEGLLLDDWLTPNKVFLEGMAKMDALKNLRPFPCFGGGD